MAATAGKITVVEAEEIVEPGELNPSEIHTPGIYVNRVIQGSFEKRIERQFHFQSGNVPYPKGRFLTAASH